MKKMSELIAVGLVVLGALGCDGPASSGSDSGAPPSGLALTSSAFAAGGEVPVVHTCEGADSSPALAWTGAPAGTQALALIVEDPTALGFVHWVLYDVPPSVSSLPTGVPSDETLTDGSRQGSTDFGTIGWSGPCPPPGDGPHTYVFTLYALDAPLGLTGGPSAVQVRDAMLGHVLGEAELRARYEIR